MAKPVTNYEQFVKLWLSDKPTAAIAGQMGLSTATMRQRAIKLRKLGVNLPKRKIASQQVDVEGLNQLIAEYQS